MSLAYCICCDMYRHYDMPLLLECATWMLNMNGAWWNEELQQPVLLRCLFRCESSFPQQHLTLWTRLYFIDEQAVMRGTTNPAPCCHLANDTDLLTPVLWAMAGDNKLTFDPPTRLPELTQNLIRSSHGHSTSSLKISCKSVQPFSRNVADKETKKERNCPKTIPRPPTGGGVKIRYSLKYWSGNIWRHVPVEAVSSDCAAVIVWISYCQWYVKPQINPVYCGNTLYSWACFIFDKYVCCFNH